MIKKSESRKTRNSIQKYIAAGATTGEQWLRAFHGGPPPSDIQQLVFMATAPRSHRIPATDAALDITRRQLKDRFADLLFPALLKNDPAPFNELLEAMAKERRRPGGAICAKLSKRDEAGRKLRLFLRGLKPDDLVSNRAIMDALAKRGLITDLTTAKKAMRELNISLLQPGDAVYFGFRTSNAEDFRCLRKIVVEKNHTIRNYRMSREDWEDLCGEKAYKFVRRRAAIS